MTNVDAYVIRSPNKMTQGVSAQGQKMKFRAITSTLAATQMEMRDFRQERRSGYESQEVRYRWVLGHVYPSLCLLPIKPGRGGNLAFLSEALLSPSSPQPVHTQCPVTSGKFLDLQGSSL